MFWSSVHTLKSSVFFTKYMANKYSNIIFEMCKQEIIFKQLTSQTLQKMIIFKSKVFVKKPAL